MSSRRKSSNPCMVQVHPAQETDDSPGPEDTLDPPISNDGTEREESESCDSRWKQPKPQPEPEQEDREDPDQNPEPSDPEQQSDKEEQTVGDSGGDGDSPESNRATQQKHPRGYECKYCPFVTQNLNDFKDHVDSSHPNVILNPLYLCAVCNFNTNKFDSLTEHNEGRHPGETNFKFKRTTRNNQTVLEQTIDGRDGAGAAERGGGDATFPPAASLHALFGGCDPIHKDQITAVNINGTVIIPEHSILQGLSHVTPLLQRPPSFTSGPKIAVPLNTTKYNPSLDDNLTLIASFNKFPYPTHAELSWLTAASKHPEEQIKVWFTTQRLKQGITWSPEEVEEARKKMFNGSIPAAHHTFTVLPTSPVSQPSAKTSPQPAHVRTGTGAPPGSAHTLKRPLPTHLTTTFGPEAKRPVMAVAPHSGNAKDKVLMAPPPPPPPQKERHVLPDMKRPVVVPLAAADMKRPPAAVPLLPPSPPSKGKILSTLGSPKTKPVVSLPSMVFPESLTRPMIAPPPIFAPSFKNSLLIPRDGAKDQPLPTAEPNMPNSPPLVSSVARRPPIIQSIPAPAKAPSQVSGFHQLQEQQGVELKASYPRGDKGVSPLSEANGTSRYDSKWAQDRLLATHNGLLPLDGGDAMATLKPDFHKSSSVLTQFPLLERMKGKSAKQLKVLEENFLRNSFPTRSDVDQLAISTRLSHQEIESWFAERRALRDNLEQALLNSMGARRASGDKAVQHHTLQLNGVHKAAPPPLLSAPTVPPDGGSLPLHREDFAPTRWPSSPEEPRQPDARTGLMRAELARWFTDGRPPSGGTEPTKLFQGGPGPVGGGSPPGTPRHCRDGTLPGSKVLEVELGWLMEQRVQGFGGPQHDELREHFAGRLRQQSAAELKNGGQNGGAMRDVFGSWLEDGHTGRGRSLVLDRDRKMDDVSGRLTG